VANPKLGTKRVCPETGRKFYDLGKDPIVSPYTGTAYPRSAFEKTPERGKATVAAAAAAPKPEEETEAVVEREADVISLEDAEVAVDDDAAVESDEAVIADAEVEVEDDAEPAQDDTFLEEEEEEGAVTDLLDVNAEDEEER
jgi:uncharacterized protein (TIGR02300 family)